jgi:hypothetical protein
LKSRKKHITRSGKSKSYDKKHSQSRAWLRPRKLSRKQRENWGQVLSKQSQAAIPQQLSEWNRLEGERWRKLKLAMLNGIAEMRDRLDPSHYIWLLEQSAIDAEIADTKKFLLRLSNEAQNTGEGAGDKPTAEENRKMITILGRLKADDGPTLKEIALETSTDCYEVEQRSLAARLRKFCLRAYRALYEASGYHPVKWTPAMVPIVKAALERWPGLEFPRDLPTAVYAVRKGFDYHRRQPPPSLDNLQEKLRALMTVHFRQVPPPPR